MNIAQRNQFDRSCRSMHVTRACKQALLAQLSWQWTERNFPGYSNQIFQVAETTLSQWAQRALLCKDSFNHRPWLLYPEMKILSNWTMHHVPSAMILAVATRFLNTTNQYFLTNFFLVESTGIHFSQCYFFKSSNWKKKIFCVIPDIKTFASLLHFIGVLFEGWPLVRETVEI